MTSNITLTSGANVVTIFTTKVEEIYEKKLNFLRYPRPNTYWSLGMLTKIIDLLIIIHVFNVWGLVTDSGSDTAQQQKTKLRNMIKAGGTVTMAYEGSNYEVNFNKCSIMEESADETTASQYDLTISLVEGEDR